jgi:hypothetical protein
MQAFLLPLIRTFEFELAPESEKILRSSSLIMTPMVSGEDKPRLALKVSFAKEE